MILTPETPKQLELGGKYGAGKFAIVDSVLFPELAKRKWRVDKDGYVIRTYHSGGKSFVKSLHSEVLGTKPGLEIDHINQNKLDNRVANLRHRSHIQNTGNRKNGKHSSIYVGVFWDKHKQRWGAGIRVKAVTYRLGRFKDEAAAARAYDSAAVFYHGQSAYLNFPAETPATFTPKK